MTKPQPLPIDAHVPAIAAAVREARAAVVSAAPGAGKTTRVPPVLAVDGPTLLLQPRRVAARSIARRIAEEQGWTLGSEIGWQMRFDRNFTRSTRLLVATEGILTARLQQDPLALDFRTIVIDEFHERSVHADLGLALVREAWRARDDLRLVVMSATLDSERVSRYLGNCPVINVPGRVFPVDIAYQPGIPVDEAVAGLFPATSGAVLCFLPGAGEIRRASEKLAARLKGAASILPLHGSLDADSQDAALTPGTDSTPRVILATNIAETTLTVPDVTCVVDTGLHKVARHDAARGIDSLATERITQDSADQRAGRAGRLRAGRAIRLWDARDRLRPHREPEVARIDLASPLLEVIASGARPDRFGWFDPPPAHAIDSALRYLIRIGAIGDDHRLTAVGDELRRLPLHPRLGRMLVASHGDPVMARACALLAERISHPPAASATSCDLLSAVESDRRLDSHIIRVAADISRSARSVFPQPRQAGLPEQAFRRAVLTAYPDRVARRRAPGSDRFVLSSGTGARQGRESGVVTHEFVVAVEVTGSGPASEALIRLATGIEREWIQPTSTAVRHAFDDVSGVVRAYRIELYDSLVLSEHPVAPDPVEAAKIVESEYLRRGPTAGDRILLRRLAFARLDVKFEDLVTFASAAATRLDDVKLARVLEPGARRRLEELAPESILVPSGREIRLEYREEGGIVAAVKLQELFGLAETPRLGPDRIPVTFELLSPAGRPVQVTNDLRSFWERGYPAVRRELRARYPKHPWPEDPWTAPPTSRPLRRKPK